ncbi:MAG: hypothetical protein AAGA65_20465 [Actinomycetota bacterium]
MTGQTALAEVTPVATQSPWTPDRTAFAGLLDGQPAYRVNQLWDGLYRNNTAPDEQTNLPKSLRATLGERFAPALRLANEQRSADGGTIK